ncbi:MAG TPA: amidohydrolase family protein [Stellaceae bacterium]|nr:amidohydrolase family protein [Stellaceae bacterium]
MLGSLMDTDYIPFHPNPSKPRFVPPAGAVDAHCHVFGPADRFPYAPERKYTPVDAPKETLFALRDFLGFERNVIVQASCHGTDNRALIDALQAAGDRARGVATVSVTSRDEPPLEEMDEAGVRAIRFNFLKRLADEAPMAAYEGAAHMVGKLGWHIVVYFEAHDLARLTPFLERIETEIVIDHMGTPNIANGVDHPDFQAFIRLMEDRDNIYTKVSCPERLSLTGPPYDDVVPFARTLVERFPDRVLWGTDWPHPNMRTHAPDDGVLTDMIPKIAPTPELQQALLVDNPMWLYWKAE